MTTVTIYGNKQLPYVVMLPYIDTCYIWQLLLLSVGRSLSLTFAPLSCIILSHLCIYFSTHISNIHLHTHSLHYTVPIHLLTPTHSTLLTPTYFALHKPTPGALTRPRVRSFITDLYRGVAKYNNNNNNYYHVW